MITIGNTTVDTDDPWEAIAALAIHLEKLQGERDRFAVALDRIARPGVGSAAADIALHALAEADDAHAGLDT